ncbi:RTA1 domain-containing protein [Aspergillus homomorphus CBS 101889]|uniref:RTA1-domain-containing protein n=1 Tax=Aspergillus homomorphus (strain CBS 101889) TaxID=1450537 RepID=A0A395I3L7_ASPHC|nr:RTA1-domain-containing protein [Aspergillus homomorphus CBS 101889]RAL14299.1 RTA1-domain-containing protein [Aspergillus homomorphus CBS 101889]
MADSSGQDQDVVYFALYRYTPSIPAAVVFAVVFCVLSIFHIYRLVRHRTFFFVPFVIGLVFEAAGYIARIFSHFDTQALGPYITQTMLILVAPPLFAASIYMTLGRLIVRLDAESASLIRVRWLTKIFVVGDVISFILQCGGGGYMAAGTLEAMENGEHIVIAGLAIQLLFFGFFILVAAVFHTRVRHSISMISVRSHSGRFSWPGLMWTLYLACALILVRSVFRVVEFVQGNDGFIMRREYLLYIFDALLMALTGIALGFVFPGSFLDDHGNDEDEDDGDEDEERKRGLAERATSV